MNDPDDALNLGVSEATEKAIAAASGHLTDMDAGALQTLRALARKIDTEQELRDRALEWADSHDAKPPAVDNVSIPTYLKYCESLGLTPIGRKALGEKKQANGKLGELRSLNGGKGQSA